MQCAGERVVVLGMGAFAIENMRTSFERRAVHVVILCRRCGTVCPQLVDWVNFIRPFDDELKHNAAGDAVVLSHWHRAYDSSGARRPECWSEGLLKPDGHTVSVSDLFFIAHHMRMLATMCGAASRLVGSCVETSSGETLDAGVLIKCVGFELNEGNEKLLGRACMHPFGLADHNLWLHFEAHLDSHAFSSPFGSSYLNAVGFNVKLMLRHWENDELRARILHSAMPSSRVNTMAVGTMLESLHILKKLDGCVYNFVLRDHVDAVATDFNVTMPINLYLTKNEELWYATHALLEGTLTAAVVSARLSYPFTTVWEEVTMAESGCTTCSGLASPTVEITLSMDQVLSTARSVVGGATLDADAPLMDAGLDSLGATELRTSLEQATNGRLELPSTLVFQAPTVRQISHYMNVQLHGESPAHTLHSSERRTFAYAPSAITGMAIRLPEGVGKAHTACLSVHCIDAVSRVPLARWDCADADLVERAALPASALPCLTNGAFMRRVELFDNRAFSISATEASVMDPQQRLLLEEGYEAMHESDHAKAALVGSCTGVFVGIDYTDFQHIVWATDAMRQSVHAATGANVAVAAGRTSFVLGLHGPSIATDTSCSSGLVATSVAHDALVMGSCSLGLATAIFVMLLPAGHVAQARAGMLSRTGRCFTFDSRADGFQKGEASGGVVLERGQAPPARSRVMLHGGAVKQDGRSASLTAPNGAVQQTLLEQALIVGNVTAASLTMLEAHGTGTALGDPTEVGSLCAAILVRRPPEAPPLALGSVKANVAHAEPAAGMSGLAVLLLRVEQARASPNTQLRILNEHVNRALRGFSCTLPLSASRHLHRQAAGVNSFGYNGTIAHVLLGVAGSPLETAMPHPKTPVRYRCRCFPWNSASSEASVPDPNAIVSYTSSWSRTSVQAATKEVLHWFVVTQRVGAPRSMGDFDSVLVDAAPAVVLINLCGCCCAAPSSLGNRLVYEVTQAVSCVQPSPMLLLFTSSSQAAENVSVGADRAGVAHSGAWGIARGYRRSDLDRDSSTSLRAY
jgi:3-oxoacyl-(acyl-carrier-protein) synthase